MLKTQAIELFGDTQVALARALGLTRAAVHHWPDELDQAQEDRVVGAAVRLGRLKAAIVPANGSEQGNNDGGQP
jgi:hypothetical protein